MTKNSNINTRIKLINFHGMNSGPLNNTGEQLLKIYGDKVILVEYDYINPNNAFEVIDILLLCVLKKGEIPLLIGNSLGGFWANYFANKYSLSVVLINPCYKPSNLLVKKLGYHLNLDNNKITELREEHLLMYDEYEKQANIILHRIVSLSEKDEAISPEHNFKIFENVGKVIICKDQTHGFKDIQTLKESIDSLVNITVS